MKELKHDNVIKYIHSYENQQAIIYDICSTSLHELLTNHVENKMGLSQSMLLKLIKDITSALNYLIYKLEIVHRDIKPSNILYEQQSNRFILADFGLAIHFDSNTLQYEDVVCGTEEFIRPDVLQLISCKDKIKIAISSEIWSLAITYFLAATGRHPFQSKLRRKWIDLALGRPNGCIQVTQEGEYMYSIERYCRLSTHFKSDVFEPLLVFMMSKEPTFRDYFSNIENIQNKTAINVFNINSFILESYDKKTFVDFATEHINNKQCIVYKLSFVTDINLNISKTTEDSPLIVLNCLKPIKSEDVKTKLEHRIFKSFSEFASSSSKYDQKQVRCVFANALSAIHSVLKQSNIFIIVTDLYMETLKSKENTFKVYRDCFENEVKEFFRIHVPKSEFEAIVNNLIDRINSSLDEDIGDFEKLDINNITDLSTFCENISLLEQNKLSPSRQEHLLQITRSMELSISSCLNEVCTYLEKFYIWIEKVKDRISSLESFIHEIQFALKELNKKLVNEIISITK